MTADLYTRAVWPIHLVDGDTADFLEDDGRRSYTVRRERFIGVNTPELHADDPQVRVKAEEARLYTKNWLEQHVRCNTDTLQWPLVQDVFAGMWKVPYFLVQSRKRDSFDRWLCVITCQLGHELNKALLDSGKAVPYDRR